MITPREAGWEDAMATVGLPSRKRYNVFVANAVNETKTGGAPACGQIWATLALAEATLLAAED
jgi:hypothetical protein